MHKRLKIIAVISAIILLGTAFIYAPKYYTLSHTYFKGELLPVSRTNKLLKLLNKVEFYQPLYGIKFPTTYKPSNAIKRAGTSEDRAETIHEYLKADIQYKKLNILDVGSSLGYMPLYFGNLNNIVLGIDNNANNVAVSNFLKTLNNNPDITFKLANFDQEYINKMPYSYDITFIFSVLHHIIYQKGLEYTQNLMNDLLDKTPILFVELAIKEEEVTAPWRSALPDNPLDIFAKCKNIHVEKLGEFGTHLSNVKRPLYVVKKQSLTINDSSYNYNTMKLRSFNHNDPKGVDNRTRRYYTGDDYYIKEVVVSDDIAKNEIKQLISFYQDQKSLISSIPVPNLIDWEQSGDRFRFVFEKIEEANVLAEQLKNLDNKQKLDIVKQTVNIMSTLEQSGIYHNDIRLWNILFQRNKDDTLKVFVIDFDMASDTKIEEPLESVLWLMYELNRESIYKLNHSKNNMFLTPVSDYGEFSDIASVIIGKKVNNLKELLDFMENNSNL